MRTTQPPLPRTLYKRNSPQKTAKGIDKRKRYDMIDYKGRINEILNYIVGLLYVGGMSAEGKFKKTNVFDGRWGYFIYTDRV